MGLIIKGLLAAFWLLLTPWAAGTVFCRKKENLTAGECLLLGYVLLFAVMELLTLPMILLDLPLHILTVSYGGIALLLGLLGVSGLWRRGDLRFPNSMKSGTGDIRSGTGMGFLRGLWHRSTLSAPQSGEEKKRRFSFSWPMLAALLLILLQICVVVLYAHMDADDSFYVATATTDLETDTIFSINPYTGYEYRRILSRYVLSPFPVFLAVVSSLSGGLHPAIMAHTVFPAVFLALGYLVLFQYARKWFPEEPASRWTFLALCAVLLWFSAYSIYNAGNFQMIRIWQGKALLAGVFLPLLFYLCMEILLEERPSYPWGTLLLANGACCLLSSMGILLAPVLMGIFLLLGLVRWRSVKRLLQGFVCCLPSLILGLVYIVVL